MAHRGNVNSDDTKAIIQTIDVGYFYNSDTTNEFVKIGETNTWSWQLGSMLQFVPDSNNKLVIFNKLVDDIQGSVIVDIDSNEVIRELKYPIYSLSKTSSKFSSINFQRLGTLRPGYGYRKIEEQALNNHPDNDGLFLGDVNSQVVNIVASYEELNSKFSSKSENTYSYINHISFSPDDKYVIFYYIETDLKKRRFVKVITYNIARKELTQILNNHTISHYCWIFDKNELIFSVFSKFGFWRYIKYDINTNKLNYLPGLLFSDSHPMVNPKNPNEIISDTYKQKSGKQYLFRSFMDKSEKEIIFSQFIPKAFKGIVRCDFHPRYSQDGNQINIDSIQFNSRCMINLTNICK